MDEYIQKYLVDILNSINEVEGYYENESREFERFKRDILRQRAIERNVEIMGEAINRILKIDPVFPLSNARAIVNTRNRVIHGYDSVTPEFLWSLLINHIPALKVEIEKLLDS